ncbi:MAG: alpha/beta fold hydrolase [Acidimicrobiales bacterium]
MGQVTERTVAINGIELNVVDAGTGPPVVLCHGFPELGYSWRHQVPALVAAGYRVLVPDMRGYGRTTQPNAIDAYSVDHIAGDLHGLLDDIGAERAVFVGHDWGAEIVWNLSVLYPERMAAVAGLSVPFHPRSAVPPTQMFQAIFGERFFYILYFQEPGVADAELNADPGHAIRKFIAAGSSIDVGQVMQRMAAADGRGLLDRFPDVDGRPSWMTDAEIGRFVEEFTRTGFTGGLNYYRNFDRNWQLLEPVAQTKVEMPAAFITGSHDVGAFMPMPGEEWVPDLRVNATVRGAGHWLHQERPDEVNALLVQFLSGIERWQ